MNDPSTAKTRTGYKIMLASCPLVWALRLPTEVALLKTESEYICLSEALRQTIYLMQLLVDMKENGIELDTSTPKVHCKIFEDNSGARKIAKAPKMRPCTQHTNIKYHHFREYVKRGLIEVLPIDTLE